MSYLGQLMKCHHMATYVISIVYRTYVRIPSRQSISMSHHRYFITRAVQAYYLD
nr:MAG TPA: hypothetical protein [Caudoviricetes sp.]